MTNRSQAALFAVAALVAAFAIAFTGQTGLASLYDDSVSYLIMAQRFAPMHAVDPPVLTAFPLEKYPPVFPLLLAFSGGAYNWRIAHALVALCFAASVFLLGLHARNITASGRIAIAAASVFALMPGPWLNVKGILSEFPFMALVYATLVWYERQRAKPPTVFAGTLLGVLLAAVLLTRTVGVALVLAVGLAEGLRIRASGNIVRMKSLAWTLGIAFGTAALWYVMRPSGGKDVYVATAMEMLSGAVDHGFTWVLPWVQANASAIADAWLNALLVSWGEPWKPGFLLACGLGLAGLVATVWRARQGEVDGIYCVIFLLILLAYPFPGQMYRLAFPILPLIMVNVFWGAERLLSRHWDAASGKRWTLWGAVVPLMLCVPPLLFYIVQRANEQESIGTSLKITDIAEFYRIPIRASAETNALLQNGVFEDMAHLRESTPAEARIMSYMPNYVALLARRFGVPLERPSNSEELVAQVRKLNPDYIYLANVHPRDSALRLGNPLDAYAIAIPFTHLVWYRGKSKQEISAVLLEVDKSALTGQ